MKCSGLAVLAVALVSATAASAQTTVTRQISDMPVETTIIRSPTETVVQRRVLPAANETIVATPRRAATRPVRTQTRVVTRTMRAPAPVYAMATAEPIVLTADQRDVVYREIVQPRVATGPTGLLAPFSPLLPPTPAVTYGYAQPVVAAPVAPVRSYVVGSRLPMDVRLVEIPPSVLMQVPSLSPYAYAMVDGRVLLVDPQTGVIVADITS